MSGKSRDKGARFERWVAGYFNAEGYSTRRTAQYCGNTGDAPDVIGLPYIHIECKAYASTEWSDSWIEQARRDAREGLIPVVIHKTDYHKPKVTMSGRDAIEIIRAYTDNNPGDVLVTMTLEDFTRAYHEYEASRDLIERSRK